VPAELIKATLTSGEVPLRVVATLRSGSIGPMMEEPALVALLQPERADPWPCTDEAAMPQGWVPGS
jgi:hypothetical protein